MGFKDKNSSYCFNKAMKVKKLPEVFHAIDIPNPQQFESLLHPNKNYNRQQNRTKSFKISKNEQIRIQRSSQRHSIQQSLWSYLMELKTWWDVQALFSGLILSLAVLHECLIFARARYKGFDLHNFGIFMLDITCIKCLSHQSRLITVKKYGKTLEIFRGTFYWKPFSNGLKWWLFLSH